MLKDIRFVRTCRSYCCYLYGWSVYAVAVATWNHSSKTDYGDSGICQIAPGSQKSIVNRGLFVKRKSKCMLIDLHDRCVNAIFWSWFHNEEKLSSCNQQGSTCMTNVWRREAIIHRFFRPQIHGLWFAAGTWCLPVG